ncbi:MAG: hypothetical protein ABIM89_03450 [Mycobacteriales bacterium]
MTPSPGSLVAARQVADAVLYEGYLLYPYRASSAKNQVRWQFGVLGPIGAADAGVGEPTSMSAEVLVEVHDRARLDVHLRFLQVQSRVVERPAEDGSWEAVDELWVAGTRWIPFHEAVPREIQLLAVPMDDTGTFEVGMPQGEQVEELRERGRLVGRLVRTRWALHGSVTVTPRAAQDPRLRILAIRVDNDTRWSAGGATGWTDRDVAARYSFVGTHLLLTVPGGGFVSLLDGPDWAAADAASCRQERCWPVLVAEDGGRDAVLVSPIILGDHPSIAPESAGDLFDATEIDEILTLRIITMTDTEKAEARGTDPRAAAILDRCDAMTDEALDLLHGARRSATDEDVPVYVDLVSGDRAAVDRTATFGEVPWWDAAEDARAEPEQDAVLVGGVPVSKGSRVILRPSRRADAQDFFLAGRAAVVARVYFDVDGGTHVAVTLEDDPASDLYGATGRFYYFGPEEIEPLSAEQSVSSGEEMR